MPPPAVQTDAAAPQPAVSLEDASARLEAALARLEALVEAGPFQSDRFRADAAQHEPRPVPGETASDGLSALRSELDAARGRERTLEAAASEASVTLDRAMEAVRQILRDDEGGPEDGEDAGELDLDADSAEDFAS